MNRTASLRILFEPPFWIGLYERWEGSAYEVCRTVFGAPPTDAEIYCWIQKNWSQLQFTQAINTRTRHTEHRNPKRQQREIRKLLYKNPVSGTWAQQAIQQQRERNKATKRTEGKKRREAEQARQFALRQEKKKARHRGH